ncbi:MAG: hypothetical protein LBQ15_04590 [Clostridium sp.]|nr:hypothetical protein [Clostridium sp.]
MTSLSSRKRNIAEAISWGADKHSPVSGTQRAKRRAALSSLMDFQDSTKSLKLQRALGKSQKSKDRFWGVLTYSYGSMPAIQPISDLRKHGEVLQDVVVGAPVFLTKNVHGRYVVLDLEEYKEFFYA